MPDIGKPSQGTVSFSGLAAVYSAGSVEAAGSCVILEGLRQAVFVSVGISKLMALMEKVSRGNWSETVACRVL